MELLHLFGQNTDFQNEYHRHSSLHFLLQIANHFTWIVRQEMGEETYNEEEATRKRSSNTKVWQSLDEEEKDRRIKSQRARAAKMRAKQKEEKQRDMQDNVPVRSEVPDVNVEPQPYCV